MESTMDRIPDSIRRKLAVRGYVNRTTLPNDKNMDLWNIVTNSCDLQGPELIELLNILFPVGK
jgi:hypothetical protein